MRGSPVDGRKSVPRTVEVAGAGASVASPSAAWQGRTVVARRHRTCVHHASHATWQLWRASFSTAPVPAPAIPSSTGTAAGDMCASIRRRAAKLGCSTRRREAGF
jgi:hypothetical protein